jgi:HK97 family phage prohead protease
MAEIQRVGPKGYIHGWIHVGAPAAGAKVFHPVHGHGTVTGVTGGHATVAFASGTHSFERHPGAGPPRLEPRAAHARVTGANGALQTSLSAGERQELRAAAKAAKKRLTAAQFKTVEQWTGGKGMVRRIQQGTVSEATARAFDEAMAEAPKVDGLVYRGVLPGSHGEKLADSLRAGSVMNLDEPVSTSIDPRQAVSFGNTLFEIETPAASYISGIGSGYAYEQEAVMAPGRFEVVSIERGTINYARAGKTGPVRIIRLRDTTVGARSWRPAPAGKAAAVSRSAALPDDDGDRSRRFMAGDGPGQFKVAREPAASAARASGDSGIPGHLPHQLAEWWERGAGAAKIRWGQGGDFMRCVRLAVEEAHMDPERAKGFCAERHHAATGIWPATHAAMEKKAAGRSAVTVTERADTKAPYGTSVPYADPGYLDADGNQASKSGKPGVKRYPLSADKVMAAWTYINQEKNAGQYTPDQLKAIKGRIRSAMAKHGHEVSEDSGGGTATAARTAGEIFRYYPLDDIRVMRAADGEPSGRVVEAYATVFDEPAEIHDAQGHYMEVIDRGAFDQVLARISRSRGGFGGAVRVLFNHGKTMEGVPAPEFQRPIGKALDIRPDGRGLLTRTEYAKKPFAEEILDDIREGRITGQSFVGGIIRSDPELRGPGDKYRGRGGVLATVRRMALGLREYGPVLYGAYTGAEFLGVRMALPGTADLELDLPEDEEYSPEQEGDVTGGTPEDVTSTPRYHAHRLLALRTEEICRETGIGPLRSQW